MIILGLLVILVLVIAVLWAAHLSLFGLRLILDVKPFEVITLGINIAIAFLLQYYLANKTKDLRSEKDLLLANLADVTTTLRSCRDALYECQDYERIPKTKKKSVLDLMKRLSNGIGHLEAAVGLSQCKKLSPEIANIWNAFDRYRAAATSTPFPVKSTPSNDQDRAFDALSSKLQALVFRINKHR
jgi:hypothetical protein